MYKNYKIFAIIPVKKKSSRLKNKNFLKIGGKTLFKITLDYAKRSKIFDEIIISSDDRALKKFEDKNVYFHFRKKKLVGEAPLRKVYTQAIKDFYSNKLKLKNHVIFGLQVDHPDRDKKPDYVIKKWFKNKNKIILIKNKKGKKTGAFYVGSFECFKENNPKKIYIKDNATNIHFKKDLYAARKRILKK